MDRGWSIRSLNTNDKISEKSKCLFPISILNFILTLLQRVKLITSPVFKDRAVQKSVCKDSILF